MNLYNKKTTLLHTKPDFSIVESKCHYSEALWRYFTRYYFLIEFHFHLPLNPIPNYFIPHFIKFPVQRDFFDCIIFFGRVYNCNDLILLLRNPNVSESSYIVSIPFGNLVHSPLNGYSKNNSNFYKNHAMKDSLTKILCEMIKFIIDFKDMDDETSIHLYKIIFHKVNNLTIPELFLFFACLFKLFKQKKVYNFINNLPSPS